MSADHSQTTTYPCERCEAPEPEHAPFITPLAFPACHAAPPPAPHTRRPGA